MIVVVVLEYGVVVVVSVVRVRVKVIPGGEGLERGGSNEVDLDVGSDVGSGGGLGKGGPNEVTDCELDVGSDVGSGGGLGKGGPKEVNDCDLDVGSVDGGGRLANEVNDCDVGSDVGSGGRLANEVNDCEFVGSDVDGGGRLANEVNDCELDVGSDVDGGGRLANEVSDCELDVVSDVDGGGGLGKGGPNEVTDCDLDVGSDVGGGGGLGKGGPKEVNDCDLVVGSDVGGGGGLGKGGPNEVNDCDLDVDSDGRGVDIGDGSVVVEVGIGIVVDIRLDRVITLWIMLAKGACSSTATQSIELRNCSVESSLRFKNQSAQNPQLVHGYETDRVRKTEIHDSQNIGIQALLKCSLRRLVRFHRPSAKNGGDDDSSDLKGYMRHLSGCNHRGRFNKFVIWAWFLHLTGRGRWWPQADE
jgi:hypothetical protein